MSQLLQDLKALVEMGVEFEGQSFKGLEYIPNEDDLFVNDFLITNLSVEWIENEIVDIGGAGYRFLIDYCFEEKVWIYILDDLSNEPPTSQNPKRLDASVSLLRKLWESKVK